MLLTTILCVVLASAVTAMKVDTASQIKPDAGPVTRSVSGVFRGSWMETRRGRRFQAYRGIRYAEPPVGELRFQPPKLILEYTTEVDASKDGPSCPQPAKPGRYVDEDCLTINVYTPDTNSSKPLPVIFFIHAGGFYSMTGRSDVAGPHYLLDRDLVLVTINYRIGSLGFLALGNKLAPGNNGFKDQVAALKWVQRNIAAFGGDPNLVTITGCSAGSLSVMVHMISPMSKGLFHRGISISGSPTSKVPSPTHRLDLARKQAKVSNCPEDPIALYECLKTKPWKEIAGSLLGFFEFGFDPLSLWRPVIEPDFGQERFLTEEPMDAIRAGRMHSVPFIVSQTTDEFFWKAFYILKNQTLLDTMNAEWNRIAPISFILPRNETSERLTRLRKAYLGDKSLANDSASADGLGKLYGDSITGFPVHRMANLMCRYSQHHVWYYEFAYIGDRSHYEDPDTKKPTGKPAREKSACQNQVAAEPLGFLRSTPQFQQIKTAARRGRLLLALELQQICETNPKLMKILLLHAKDFFEMLYEPDDTCRAVPTASCGESDNVQEKKREEFYTPKGVAHHDDLIYLFSLSYRFPTIDVADTQDSAMVDRMTALWYNFARYGDPNPREDTPELGSLAWPSMKPDQRTYLRIDKEFTLKQNLNENRFNIWEELYPIEY